MAKAALKLAKGAQKLATALVTGTPRLVSEAASFSRPRLAVFWYYARVELAPPTPAELPKAVEGVKGLVRAFHQRRFSQLSVAEAVRNGLVATEVLMWFFIGEIIGKHTLIGYDV